ncbi:hypothetical protein [Haloferax sp. ATB1]
MAGRRALPSFLEIRRKAPGANSAVVMTDSLDDLLAVRFPNQVT